MICNILIAYHDQHGPVEIGPVRIAFLDYRKLYASWRPKGIFITFSCNLASGKEYNNLFR